MTMEVIPAVDVLGGEVVRLIQGDYGSVTRYDVDPVAVASRFVAEGATLVHVVDLEAARGRECALDVVERLSAAGVPFQLGGGIRSAAVARAVIDLGAERVVIGSALVSDAASAKEIVEAVGHGAVVGAVDVLDGRERGSGWPRTLVTLSTEPRGSTTASHCRLGGYEYTRGNNQPRELPLRSAGDTRG